jgi:hypothetical protein
MVGSEVSAAKAGVNGSIHLGQCGVGFGVGDDRESLMGLPFGFASQVVSAGASQQQHDDDFFGASASQHFFVWED